MIQITVNNRKISAESGEMLLSALNRAGIKVPTLCHIPELGPSGNCRMCCVEIVGKSDLKPACAFPVSEGLEVLTHSPRVIRTRQTILQLLLRKHPNDCLNCSKGADCELRRLADAYGVRPSAPASPSNREVDQSGLSIAFDPAKCILCSKCVRVCNELMKVHAINIYSRGRKTFIGPEFYEQINNSSCVECGQCLRVCPTGAIYETDSLTSVLEAMHNPELYKIAVYAPIVPVSLAEKYGVRPGLDLSGHLNAVLRQIGFREVFDVSIGVEINAEETAAELRERIKTGGPLPLFSSRAPSWVQLLLNNYPEFVMNLSKVRGPQSATGTLIRNFYADKVGIPPEKLFIVSILPCTSKKTEAAAPIVSVNNLPDINAVLSVKELLRLMSIHGTDLLHAAPESCEREFGESTPMGHLIAFPGTTADSLMRAFYRQQTGRSAKSLKVVPVSNANGIYEFHVKQGKFAFSAVVINGLGPAKAFMEDLRKNPRKDLLFVEVSACPDGCFKGPALPYGINPELLHDRMHTLFIRDTETVLRGEMASSVEHLYHDFLKEPGSPEAAKYFRLHFGGLL